MAGDDDQWAALSRQERTRTGKHDVSVLVLDLADSHAESINAFENKVSRPGASKVADCVKQLPKETK